jgi:hypothetical protein
MFAAAAKAKNVKNQDDDEWLKQEDIASIRKVV